MKNGSEAESNKRVGGGGGGGKNADNSDEDME